MTFNSSYKGTTLTYNGVVLQNCLTKVFDQEIQYDESGTDRIYNRFMISVESLVSDADVSDFTSLLSSNLGAGGELLNAGGAYGFNAQSKLKIVHALLSVPRQDFKYEQGDQVVIEANSRITSRSDDQQWFGPDTDLNNGPKPKSVRVSTVVGNRVYKIEFTIEVCLLYCDANDPNRTPSFATNFDISKLTPEKNDGVHQRRLVSNRFSIEESRDGNFYNTRTLFGRARVAHVDLWHEAIRILCLPSLQPGYKRESVQFVVDPNGLDLTYRITDKQRYAAPPYPATDFQGVHQETTGIAGAEAEGAIQVKVFGSPDSLKKALLLVAVSIIQCRIGEFGKIGESDNLTSVIPISVTITDILQDNVIDVAVQYSRKMVDKDGKPTRWLDIMMERLGLFPSVAILTLDPKLAEQGKTSIDDPTFYRKDGRPPNQDVWPVPNSPWDDGAPYGIFAQYLQDGCVPVHSTPDTRYTDEVEKRDAERPPPRTAVVSATPIGGDLTEYPGPPPGELQVSEDQTTFPYTHIQIRSDYHNDFGYVALPKLNDYYTPQDGDVLITKLHAATCRKNVFISAKRAGGQPDIPEIQYVQTDENGIVYVLDEMHPEFVAPVLMPDQINYEYELNIRLNYLMSRALKATDKLSLGSLPWDNTTREQNETDLSTDRQKPMNPIKPKSGESSDDKDANKR